MTITTNRRGYACEALVEADLLLRGFEVAHPRNGMTSFDLVAFGEREDRSFKAWRIQVKSGVSCPHPTNHEHYTCFDILARVDTKTNEIRYFIPNPNFEKYKEQRINREVLAGMQKTLGFQIQKFIRIDPQGPDILGIAK